METKKKVLFIIFTIGLVIAICVYLHILNQDYGGALLDSTVAYYVTIPIICILDLVRILKGVKEKTPSTQSKIIIGLVLLIGIAFIVSLLIASEFYNLTGIILGVLLISVIPHIYKEGKRREQLEKEKDPILTWGNVVMSTYCYIILTAVIYIAVVEPVSVVDASAYIDMEYGEESYEYVGHLTGNREENHLGVYWFARTEDEFNDLVEVDVLSGTIEKLGESLN